jgi:DNA-binding transcriptional LysR family regulator
MHSCLLSDYYAEGIERMDLNWLQDFVCLGRTLNFTRAAEEQNITQSAFSRRIKSLEIWLGVPLIKRSTYPVQLSEAGQLFLPVARETITNLTDIRQNIRAEDRGSAAFQRFAVLHAISVNYLSQRIAELERQLPNLRVRVYSDNLRTCCQFLAEGTCDFLLYYRHKEVAPAFDETQFARKDIGTERMIPVAETRVARAGKWDLSQPRTDDIPYLGYDPSSYLGTVVDQMIGTRKPRLALRYMDTLTEAIKRRALTGGGIAWLPEGVVADEIARGDLVVVGGEDWQTTLTLSLFCSLERLDKTGQSVWEAL